MSSEQQDRVLDALTDSTKAQQQQARRIDSLERKFDTLESTLSTRISALETEMSTMNAHLDNLVREAQTTNQLLRDEADARKEEVARKQKIEDEERALQREMVKDNRETVKKIGSELWEMFRHPLGYLMAGIAAWVLYHYFAVPHSTTEGTSLAAPSQVVAP